MIAAIKNTKILRETIGSNVINDLYTLKEYRNLFVGHPLIGQIVSKQQMNEITTICSRIKKALQR
jgi:hypothetical protein